MKRWIWVVAVLIAVLAFSSVSMASVRIDLSTPQNAYMTWQAGLIYGDLRVIKAVLTDYGDMGKLLKQNITQRHADSFSRELQHNFPTMSKEQLVSFVELFKDSWRVVYLSETAAFLRPNIGGASMGMDVIMVKESDGWKLGLMSKEMDAILPPE